MMQDRELLRAYWRDGSEPAFAELVQRYVGLVFSTARRQLGDAALAEDVSQTVFCLLARKARSLCGAPTLAGWLYRATCFCAARAARRERRRRKREQEAIAMNSLETKPGDVWERLAPLLDEALATLGEKERLTILLRFFQGKPMQEVGHTLGISEAAAKMRVSRSLERLRQFLARRGVACSTGGLAVLLTGRATEAAPANLARKLSEAALAGITGLSGLSLIQSLPLLARFNSGTLILGCSAAVACVLAGWHFLHASAQPASMGPVAEQTKTPAATTSEYAVRERRGRSAATQDHDELTDAINNLRAALHSTDDTYIPGAAVIAAVYRFGSRVDAAFPILKEEAGAHDRNRLATDPLELAPRRAVSAMGFLGKSVPQAAPWLWDLYEQEPSTASDSMAFHALSALEQIGFQPQDIGTLAEEVLAKSEPWGSEVPEQSGETSQQKAPADGAFVKGQVAEWVAKLIREQPAETAPFIPALQNLLASPDEDARFWAACALLPSQGRQDPAIISEISQGLKNATQARIAWASKLLQQFGDAARPIVPALLEAANASTGNTRDWAFLSAGKIQDDLRNQIPEVEQCLAKQEADQALLDRLNSGQHTAKDLIALLEDPGSAAVAANLLAEQFPLAKDTLPALCAAAARPQNKESMGAILTSLRKLDPTAALAPEDAASIVMNLSNAQEDGGEPVVRLVAENHLADMSWSTRPGFQTFAANLAVQNPKAYTAFVTAVLEKAPSWKSLLP